MKPILISKQQHQNNDLVLLVKKEYERPAYRAIQAKDGELDDTLKEAIRDVKEGRVSRSFDTANELMDDLLK